MSSLSKETKRKGWRVQGRLNRERFSLYLNDPSKRRAQTVCRHIDELCRSIHAHDRPEPATTRWLSEIGSDLYAKLVRAGLTEPRSSVSGDAGRLLEPFIDAYIATRTDLAKRSLTNYRQTRDMLVNYFGEDRTLSSITEADAEEWARWMTVDKGYAEATTSKHRKRAKQYFNYAVKARILDSNPFQNMKGGKESNPDRYHFVDTATTQRVVAALTGDLKAAFALARYGGLRCPSEVTRMRWTDIQWDEGKIRIESEKTGLRFAPLFPELRAVLEPIAMDREQALLTNERIVRGYVVGANLGTQIRRELERAGISAWGKLFQNLRSTRRTELQEKYPSHVCDAWLGHSTAVAKESYLQVTDDHWRRGTGGVISAETDQSQQDEESELSTNSRTNGDLTTIIVHPRGFEPLTFGSVGQIIR